MAELSKIFSHLSRDLFIYFLTGFIVVIDLAYLDYLFNTASTFKYIKTIPYWAISSTIIAFTIGHLVFSIMYFIFEYTKLEIWLKKKLFSSYDHENNKPPFEISFEKEIKIFEKKRVLHDQFIERHTQLYLMRWNLAGGFMFSGLTNILFEIYFHFTIVFTALSILSILIGFSLYVLSLKTEKDCFARINKIADSI
ncbi:hypothetical protein [Flavobacterium ginsenosidimutans]|uniref:2TM domain-containing protein n=1 Tax=Flavobacterium ginsenosidimutans TaxID=687844 RepID=A0ABZ2QEI2_9FLAO|nr:hypothetical protein [Flavobacterium ginsenosidimutans]KAF2338069.1 hypothetical protein DM444_01430 [Flavobacterium ginsenosidimutans]